MQKAGGGPGSVWGHVRNILLQSIRLGVPATVDTTWIDKTWVKVDQAEYLNMLW